MLFQVKQKYKKEFSSISSIGDLKTLVKMHFTENDKEIRQFVDKNSKKWETLITSF